MSSKSPPNKPAPPPPPPPADDASERLTVRPPFDEEAFAKAADDAFRQEEDITRRVTLTSEAELEEARVRSIPSAPPHAEARATSVLSMANARPPTVPPASPGPRSTSPTSLEAAALDLVAAAAAQSHSESAPEISEHTIEDPLAEMKERVSLGDYTGAMELAELILADEPDNVEAAACGESCRTMLSSMYAARLGPLDRVPMVVVPRGQMHWLSMDHRTGFVLSLVDGASSLETILDVSGMPRLDALRILSDLVQRKVISFRAP